MKALLFSGQGSQYVGMMKDLYETFPTAKTLIDKADNLLGFKLSEICFEGPLEVLKETRYTQPAIFLHSAIIFELIKEKIQFNAVAGHSVGEYTALFSAGVLSFEDALTLCSVRGQLMFEAGKELPGTMFAIIGLPEEKVEEICKELTEKGNGQVIVPANYNSTGQVVVSGSAEYLRANANEFKKAGAKMVTELVVSGAFHSPLMLPAKEKLQSEINKKEFQNAKVPVYSNVYAKPLTDAEEIRKALVMQLDSPVRWTQSLIRMQEDGINTFIEIGPGKVLQGLVKRTLSNVEILGFDKAEDIQKFLNN